MSIRRQFRIKVLQFLYAQYLSNIDFYQIEKNLLKSIEELNNLYLSLLCLTLTIRDNILILEKKIPYKKLNFAKNFAHNFIIKTLYKNKYLLELHNSSKNIWKNNNIIVFYFIKKMNKLPLKENFNSIKDEKLFFIKNYQNLFSSNIKLLDFVEEFYSNGLENYSIAHNIVYKTFLLINSQNSDKFKLYNFYEDIENKKFIINLYWNTILHKKELNIIIKRTSKNWNIKRIAIIELIILQMATCEFLYFPNIPPKATINEYIEISKIFCMEKSKNFINGILDNIYKSLEKQKKSNNYV
ncbi:transcription antitermination factor NusB [Blattabacterium cuenoti]|uniref:transcription antitermination factor NusB n=1 Tax=Blattabacterium cuenoti TaxID=1653831 RepID=UPI00163D2365|nr:transcription antitermination factor NusB [Blattabacterium cuenoti]